MAGVLLRSRADRFSNSIDQCTEVIDAVGSRMIDAPISHSTMIDTESKPTGQSTTLMLAWSFDFIAHNRIFCVLVVTIGSPVPPSPNRKFGGTRSSFRFTFRPTYAMARFIVIFWTVANVGGNPLPVIRWS